MKKLSISVVLVVASVTFANAQTTEAVKAVKTDTTVTTEVKADTNVATPAVESTKKEVVKTDEAALKQEAPAETKQKARKEKKMEANKEAN